MPGNENCEACPKLEDLHTQIEDLYTQIAGLKRQIPHLKPNLLGAGRKKKVTPQIERDVLKLRAEGLSFADIAIAINEHSTTRRKITLWLLIAGQASRGGRRN